MSADNVEIVQSFLGVLGELDPSHIMEQGDVDQSALDALLHPDFEIANPLFHPVSGVISGVGDDQGVLRGKSAMMIDVVETSSRWEIKVKDTTFHDVGDFVLFMGNVEVAGRTSGRAVCTPFTELIWVRDSKVLRVEPFINTAAFAAAL